MPLMYSVVARGNTVLARYATCQGNFAEVTEEILTKIPPLDSKMTYSHGSYLFHYISEDGIVYLCISDNEFERSRAFLYLTDTKNRFQSTYGRRAHTALAYAMNTEFAHVLANGMKHYSESKDVDKISRVQGQLDELKDIMVKNIDTLTERGEKMELLVDKTEHLSANAVTFKKSSRTLEHSLYWKNIKLILIIVVVVIVILYFIVSMACGGLDWHNCVAK